jgi:hypothetical protein
MWKNILGILAFLPLLMISCNDPDNPDPQNETGKIRIHFLHLYNNEGIVFDTMKYSNAAGNQLMFSEIQYFISDVELHYTDGSKYEINKWKDIHYVDSDIPSTQTWDVYDSIPAGNIDSISFTFGINEQKNQSYMYVNPPESLMFWPDILGGGYHYLKLNGKWLNEDQLQSPFNFHVQNYFRVGAVLPPYSSYTFSVRAGETSGIALVMNVESWFETPAAFDFNFWGGDIMQNQDAMHAGCLNGQDVFSLYAPPVD